jgi:hypothetical protein
MFIVYMCIERNKKLTRGSIAFDYIEYLTDEDYDTLRNNESVWIVPGTLGDNQ